MELNNAELNEYLGERSRRISTLKTILEIRELLGVQSRLLPDVDWSLLRGQLAWAVKDYQDALDQSIYSEPELEEVIHERQSTESGEVVMKVGAGEGGFVMADVLVQWKGEDYWFVDPLENFTGFVERAEEDLLQPLLAAESEGEWGSVGNYGKKLAALGMAMMYLAASGETVQKRMADAGLPLRIVEMDSEEDGNE